MVYLTHPFAGILPDEGNSTISVGFAACPLKRLYLWMVIFELSKISEKFKDSMTTQIDNDFKEIFLKLFTKRRNVEFYYWSYTVQRIGAILSGTKSCCPLDGDKGSLLEEHTNFPLLKFSSSPVRY